MIKIKVQYKIWDTIKHIVSKKDLFVIWYKYIESQWIQYIVIDDEQKELYAIPYEVEQTREEYNIWFIYNP